MDGVAIKISVLLSRAQETKQLDYVTNNQSPLWEHRNDPNGRALGPQEVMFSRSSFCDFCFPCPCRWWCPTFPQLKYFGAAKAMHH